MKRDQRGEQSRFPLFGLLAGTVCISFSPIFIKLAAVPPDVAGFYRMLFAAAFLLPLLLVRRIQRKLSPRTVFMLAAGGVSLALDLMCWHRSIHLIGPGLSTLLANFQVFFTALFCRIFLKQRIGWVFMLAVLMALGGLSLITGTDWSGLSEGVRLGLALAIGTAVFYSIYITAAERGDGRSFGKRRRRHAHRGPGQQRPARRRIAGDRGFLCHSG